MAYTLILISFFCFSIPLLTQNHPAEIIRHDIECNLDRNGKLTIRKKLILKINSPLGRDKADIKIYYDSKSSFKSVHVKILNVHDELIKTFKKKEIKDYALATQYFHTDDRYMEVKAYHNAYPYLIDLEYVQEFYEFLSFPTWYPQNKENIPLKESSYKLIVPVDYPFHNRFYNFQAEEEVQIDESSKIYIWKTKNLAPIVVHESFMPSIKSIYPSARFFPENFVFGGIKGTSKTWKDIGIWQSRLISGLDELPKTEIEKILELTKQASNDLEKVKIIYEYLQNETRYIGVFIGIGGWKPHNATYVSNKKYGDCKALVNYMMAMLKSVGIKSYYSLIVADENEPDIDPSLPGLYFNHVVLCVPMKNDTLWLECTSQTNPFNYWGTFTNGKHALVCDYENSFITQTPQFDFNRNYVNQTSIVNILEGKLIVNMERQLVGEAFEKVNTNLKYGSDKEVLDIATKTLPFKNYSLSNVKYQEIDIDGAKGYNESLQLTFSGNIIAYGSQLVISPFNKYLETTFPLNSNRQNPISFFHDFKITDSLQYNIPENFELEAMPDDFEISSIFGKCEVRYQQVGNKLVISKFVEINRGLYSAIDYAEFKSFIISIISAESQKVLLRKL